MKAPAWTKFVIEKLGLIILSSMSCFSFNSSTGWSGMRDFGCARNCPEGEFRSLENLFSLIKALEPWIMLRLFSLLEV